MRTAAAVRAEKKRLRKLADQVAYEGATRLDVREVIPSGPGLQAILQAVYTTPDPLDHVDSWYRQYLEFLGDCPGAGVRFAADGRRWSYFRDGLKYRKLPTIQRRPMTVRQYVFEAEGSSLVVLACRQPTDPVTVIAVTVLAGEVSTNPS